MRLSALLFSLLMTLSLAAHGEKLRIVTDPWAPYVYEENGKPTGLDFEITSEIFSRLGIDVEWEFLPWRRCLSMIEQGQADAVLDIYRTPERERTLLYPDEPLSEVQFVLFHANARPHGFKTLDDLAGLTIGISPGYTYNQAFLESNAFRREPAPTQEANFGKLVRGRIDMVLTDRRVGRFTLRSMGLADQVSDLPTVLEKHQQFLAVRPGVGMDLLVQRFAAELRRFKREPAYQELQTRYLGEIRDGETVPDNGTNANQAVEQHDNGAQ